MDISTTCKVVTVCVFVCYNFFEVADWYWLTISGFSATSSVWNVVEDGFVAEKILSADVGLEVWFYEHISYRMYSSFVALSCLVHSQFILPMEYLYPFCQRCMIWPEAVL